MGTTIRIGRERKELISKYATATVSLYGMLSTEEFVEVFNYYESESTTVEEAYSRSFHKHLNISISSMETIGVSKIKSYSTDIKRMLCAL